MSAPTKRRASDNSEVIQKKQSHRDVQNDKLKTFITWANDRKFNLNKKVRVGREGSCAQYGMVATDDIMEGETLFQIPREMLLHPATTEIKDLLNENGSSLESTSGWVPLLVSLMYEYNRPTSAWRPYFDLVPDFNDLDLPMFWSREERDKLLSGTGVPESVSKDLGNIESEFREVVLPFVEKHIDKFSPVCKDLEFYKKMVAFVMAYSFTEPIKSSDKSRETEQASDDSDCEDDEEEVPSPPMMVPMADILNHVAKNNAKLTFEKDALKMVATKEIEKGEEVFNTYGELSNSHLLHMYGFAEPYPDNHYDEVIICGQTLLEAAKELECHSEDTFSHKKSLLESMGLLETTFVAGVEGILTEEEMIQALKIWTMPADAVTSYMENEGWVEDESDESLLYENGIGKLSKDIKLLLSRCATECLKRYETTIDEDETILKKNTLSSRQQYALYVKIGQKQILQKLIDSCR